MKSAFVVLAVLSSAILAPAAITGNKFVKYTHDERGTPMAHVIIDMATLFPGTAGDLSGFNVDVGYTNYNATLFDKIAHDLADADAAPAIKVAAAVSVLHGTEHRPGVSAQQDEDHYRLLSLVDPVAYTMALGAHQPRSAYVQWATSHAISLVTCAGFLSCVSGTTCSFYVTINKAPRSRCESQGGQNCCLSWSTYNVKAGFFQATWTACYDSRPGDTESCEGHDNDSGEGGDVCYSNRATGCT
jgi:hypothetical protein